MNAFVTQKIEKKIKKTTINAFVNQKIEKKI